MSRLIRESHRDYMEERLRSVRYERLMEREAQQEHTTSDVQELCDEP